MTETCLLNLATSAGPTLTEIQLNCAFERNATAQLLPVTLSFPQLTRAEFNGIDIFHHFADTACAPSLTDVMMTVEGGTTVIPHLPTLESVTINSVWGKNRLNVDGTKLDALPRLTKLHFHTNISMSWSDGMIPTLAALTTLVAPIATIESLSRAPPHKLPNLQHIKVDIFALSDPRVEIASKPLGAIPYRDSIRSITAPVMHPHLLELISTLPALETVTADLVHDGLFRSEPQDVLTLMYRPKNAIWRAIPHLDRPLRRVTKRVHVVVQCIDHVAKDARKIGTALLWVAKTTERDAARLPAVMFADEHAGAQVHNELASLLADVEKVVGAEHVALSMLAGE
ncbi:hypothetical protein GGF31_006234 [Allomyces arbusculus]|nr:hypothetical protein GGF31_006234 [Allomyces arbusculus]